MPTPEELNAAMVQGYTFKARELSEKLTAAFGLSLAVGNGGALVLLGGKVLEEGTEALTALAMPSCWLFAVGLLIAGALNPLAAWRANIETRIFEGWMMQLVDADRPSPNLRKVLLARLYKTEVACELISGACFVIGLIYPLAVLSIRYLHSGQGFFPTP